MRIEIALLSIVSVLFAAERALACGPDFPHRLLQDRKATMEELVDGSFDWEAARLAPSKDRFVVVEGDEPPGARDGGGDHERALYDEGASLWNEGKTDEANDKWRALLALPVGERKVRSTWAAFMLGRSTGDAQWYEMTRALARLGFEDDLGLAAASLGEQARDLLESDDVVGAVRLYAEQAAQGHVGARASLLFVVRDLLRDDAKLGSAIHDRVVQRLVGAYLYTRALEVGDEQKVKQFVDTLDEEHIDVAVSADLVAAAAYRAGHFDLAKRLADRSEEPLALWVRAKLALRDGDTKVADELLARVARLFPASAGWGEAAEGGDYETVMPACRATAERAVLALQRREYALALDRLLSEPYWLDAAYIAERVLTLDELRAFVAKRAPRAEPLVKNEWGYAYPSVRSRLRALLGRRLIREGHCDEGAAYLDDEPVREKADDFCATLERDDAQSRFDAAVMLRRHGIEISGTELDPDWAVYGGSFDLGEVWDGEGMRVVPTAPPPEYASDDELVRSIESRPSPNVRFHYRVRAADMLMRLADDLPPRSQAFAAVLCRGSSWLLDREPDLAAPFYERYIREGALVDFAGTFGRSCPAPIFQREPPSDFSLLALVALLGVLRIRSRIGAWWPLP